jgi:hypothetical protein
MKDAFTQLREQMDAMTHRIIADAEAHALTCPDPVACELRAWQAILAMPPVPDPPKVSSTFLFWKTGD